MSDLVERLKIEASEDLDGEVRESAIEVMREAATALTAKDKEIEALRTKPPTLDAQSIPRVDALIKTLEARAETAERERDMLGEVIQDTAHELGCENDNEAILIAIDKLRRERDEARAALKPFAEAASGYDDSFSDDEPTWGNYGLKLGHLRAARAVIKQGE